MKLNSKSFTTDVTVESRIVTKSSIILERGEFNVY